MRIRPTFLSHAAAALIATFALAACQHSDSTAPVAPSETLESGPGLDALETRMAPEGRPATADEIAELNLLGIPDVDLPESHTPLAKVAALPTCIVNFNQPAGLDAIPQDAYNGIASHPFYTHSCNTSYSVKVLPSGHSFYRLTPEAANWCPGASGKIGTWVGSTCANQSPAINWPRKAGNFGGNNSAVYFKAFSSTTPKTFNLQAITVRSGTARVMAVDMNGNLVNYTNIRVGRTTWPAGTSVRAIYVFHQNNYDVVHFDNLEIAINP